MNSVDYRIENVYPVAFTQAVYGCFLQQLLLSTTQTVPSLSLRTYTLTHMTFTYTGGHHHVWFLVFGI